MITIRIFALLIVVTVAHTYEYTNVSLTFPKGFLIGTASSAYQIEGAWNIADKSENIWDYHTHNHPWKVRDQSSGDITSDAYHKFKEDIKLMEDIGFDFYRFSISWTRILPTGYDDVVSRQGLQYYHDLLDELEYRGIIPFVTIYHWDHPQKFENEFGGWLDEQMAFLFSKYARVVFREFGHRVKIFSTVNEPYVFCSSAYKRLSYPPSKNLSGSGDYMCIQNMLKGHALAYHIYNDEFRSKYDGKIGLVMPDMYPYSKNPDDETSVDVAFEFEVGMTANPIFSKDGDYPGIVKQRVAARSAAQGMKESRLPTLSDFWINYIRGTADYFGLNHYTSYIVEPLAFSDILNWPDDTGLNITSDPQWDTAQSPWLNVVPKGFGDLLRKIKNKYDNPPVYVMENGVSDGNRTNDDFRINYLYSYMKEMLVAIKRDGCDVRAYTYWSFLDSFEWDAGFTEKFGLMDVDFTRQDRKRTPKKSATWLRRVIRCRKLYDICGN